MIPPRFRREWPAVLALSALTLLAVVTDPVPALRGPAPYPPEWRWDLRGGPTSGRWAPVMVTAGALTLLAWVSGSSAARRHPRRAAALLLAGAVVTGFAFHLALLALEPEGAGAALMRRATSRTVTSYYTVAVSPDADSPAALLDEHAERLFEWKKAAKHAATHPPGPILFYRGVLGLCRAAPALCAAAQSAFGIAPEGGRREADARATALVAPLLVIVLGALVPWPIAVLARLGGADPLAAARIGLSCQVVPAACLFSPHFDPLLALPVAGAAALVARSVPDVNGIRIHWALAGGLVAGIAVQMSYGAAVMAAIAVTAAIGLVADASGAGGRRRAAVAVSIATVAATAVVALPMIWGHEPVLAARRALSIHRETYTAPRDYRLWLLFNPLDLAIFLGVPLAMMAAVATWGAARATHPRSGFERFRLATAAGLVLLLLSGLVRGELGRIGAPLLPLLLIAALAPRAGEGTDIPTAGEAAAVIALLAALTVAMGAAWSVA